MDVLPNILVFSRDQMLLVTRQLILEAFAHAEGAARIQDAESLITQCRFDLIVLCHSIPHHEAQTVFDLVRRHCPETKILTLAIPGNDPIVVNADQELLFDSGPDCLLKKTSAMLGIDLRVPAHSSLSDLDHFSIFDPTPI